MTVVVDASVLINVLASGYAKEILIAYPDRLLVVDQVVHEVRFDPVDPVREPSPKTLEPFISERLLYRMSLSAEGLESMLELTMAPRPDDLHDGEAASIALAHEIGARVATDDKKAQRVCSERFPKIGLISSVEVFRHASVRAALGGRLAEALMCAISRGRMRVPKPEREWVKGVLQELAEHCPFI